MPITHPLQALYSGSQRILNLASCDHYAGSERFILKAFELKKQYGDVLDITLDCEDGAALGQEQAHIEMLSALCREYVHGFSVGLRTHDSLHPAFRTEIECAMRVAGERIAYIMLPKVESAATLEKAARLITQIAAQSGLAAPPALHALIETHSGLREVFAIAAHPLIESLSFGVMDFVASHQGAIGLDAIGAQGQMQHPLLRRAKLEISAACHCYGKVPSHSVVQEFDDIALLTSVIEEAKILGFTRQWSIHPKQIPVILQALSPNIEAVQNAAELLLFAAQKDWTPVRWKNRLEDRASYRIHWQLLQRAQQLGMKLDKNVTEAFFT